MAMTITWSQDSNNPKNTEAFQEIHQWWEALNGEEITWQQRLSSSSEDWHQLDWSPQRFDERFFITNPVIRGITLYWFKASQAEQEQSTTPQRLVLNSLEQALYIFPKSQQGLVVKASLPQIPYTTIALTNPAIERSVNQGNLLLTFKDPTQGVAVQVTLNPETLLALKRQLP